MKKGFKSFFIGALIAVAILVSCENATADDCRDDSRCFESPSKKGTFFSKNPSNPCPCAD